jgi:thiamine biosynthesis protein ThiI
MKFIVKLHPEITIKSKSVRKRFTKLLDHNIRNVFKANDLSVEVRNQWDKLLLLVNPSALDKQDQVIDIIKRIPGIDKVLLVEESPYTDLDDIFQQVKSTWHEQLVDKTFAVRVKRRGQHNFSSMDIARYVGGGLNQHCDSKGVKLQNPDVTVEFEVEDDTLIMVKQTIRCLGGMPLPTQEDVLSLISGGFDSGVSTFQMIRRGARTHFCFFNLGGREHEIGVKQVSYYLWQRYSQSHKVKFIAVDFEAVLTDILENVENGQMGVVLKRMMMRAASKVADNLGIDALVTGESLGQVSSQTMTNLHVIDQCTSKLILRPLICMDKQEIIDIAKQIGTEDFAKVMPEYCGVISRKPTVKAQLDSIEAEEAKCDLGLIDQVVRAANVVDIRRISEEAEQEVASVASADSLSKGAVVLDIRSPEEQEHKPLSLPQFDVVHIPFYRLATKFPDLDQSREYFLYCDRGVMSKMQALILHEKGYTTVKVYRP